MSQSIHLWQNMGCLAGVLYNQRIRRTLAETQIQMYRYAAYEMLHRLNLEKAFNAIKEDPLRSQQKHVIAKALWGLFCFER